MTDSREVPPPEPTDQPPGDVMRPPDTVEPTVAEPPVAEPVAALVPKLRSRRKLYVLLGAAGTALLIALGVSTSLWALARDEEQAWTAASRVRSEAGWQQYVDWSTRARGGIGGFLLVHTTQIDVHTETAQDNVLSARAQGAVAREDWPAVCELYRSQRERQAGRIALDALHQRIERGRVTYHEIAVQRGSPDSVRTSIEQGLGAMRANPCGEGALIRLGYSVDQSSEFGVRLSTGKTITEVLGSVDLATSERSLGEAIAAELTAATGGALPVRAVRPTDAATGVVEILVSVAASPSQRFLDANNRQLSGLVLSTSVSARQGGRGVASESQAQRAEMDRTSLPSNFALDLAQAGTPGHSAQVEDVYRQAVVELFPEVAADVRRALGLQQRRIRTNYDFSDVRPIAIGQALRGRTAREEDSFIGGCIERQDYYDSEYGSGDDPPMYSDAVHRMVLTERSEVAIAVSSEFSPVLYVRTQLNDDRRDIACVSDGSVIQETLDPGSYFIVVDTTQDDGYGTYTLAVARHEPGNVAPACAAATPLALGEAQEGTTAGGSDAMWGSCGGVGAPEKMHTFEVAEPSRLRCRLQGELDGVLYLRSQCGLQSSEVTCAAANLANGTKELIAEIQPGRHTLVVDGEEPGESGRYEVQCSTVPIAGGTAFIGDSCAGPAILTQGRIDAELFSAHDDIRMSCAREGMPDLVYRLDLGALTQVVIRVSGAQRVGVLSRGCGDRGTEVSCGPIGVLEKALPAGTYFFALEATDRTLLQSTPIDVRLDNLDAVCNAAPLLTPGTTSGRFPDGPGRFRGSCSYGTSFGSEDVYRIRLAQRSAVRVALTLESSGLATLYLRRTCGGLESGCASSSISREPTLALTLDAGEYWLVVDNELSGRRAYELEFSANPP